MTLPHLQSDLQALFTHHAERLGQATQLIQRRRQLTASTFAQTLIFGWLDNPDATLDELASLAAALDAPLTPQALDQRFNERSAQFLKVLLLEACRLRFQAKTPAPLAPFDQIVLLDASTVALPACVAEEWNSTGGKGPAASLKVHVALDLLDGHLQVHVAPGRSSDQRQPTAHASLRPGSLRLADLAYFNLGQFQALSEAGVAWVSRFKTNLQVWAEEGTQRLNLSALLAATTEDTFERRVRLGEGRRLSCRLVAFRLPTEVATKREKVLRLKTRRDQRRMTQGRLDLMGWRILLTNVDDLPPEALNEWYGVRWQIELLFKLWKKEGRLSQSRSQKPWRQVCEVYAKLLGLLIQHWVSLEGWGVSHKSLVKMGRMVRKFTLPLLSSLANRRDWNRVMTRLKKALRKGCQVRARQKEPATWQRLERLRMSLT